MGLQARMNAGDDRLYDVSRDVAHCFGDVCRETAERLETAEWPFLRAFCAGYGITESELGEACRAFLEYVATATDVHEERRPAESLTRVGWFEVPEAAQFAFGAVMMTVMTGYFHTGVRQAATGGMNPCLLYQDLREGGRRTAQVMMLPRWRRRLVQLKRHARLWLLRRLGAEPAVVSLEAHLDQARAGELHRQLELRRRTTAAQPPRDTNAEREAS